MWKIKKWKFTEHTMDQARLQMEAWLKRRKRLIQYEEIFVDNAYAVQYRYLLRVY